MRPSQKYPPSPSTCQTLIYAVGLLVGVAAVSEVGIIILGAWWGMR